MNSAADHGLVVASSLRLMVRWMAYIFATLIGSFGVYILGLSVYYSEPWYEARL